MNRNAQFDLDEAGVNEFLRSAAMRSEMERIGDKLHARVRRNSSGKFRDELGMTNARLTTVDGSQAVVVDVYTDDDFAHLYEFGSVNNKPYAPMSRAAESMGFRVER